MEKIKSLHPWKSIKEFIHPSNVTWMSRKDTRKETIAVFCVVLVAAAIMIAGDSLFGFLLGLLVK